MYRHVTALILRFAFLQLSKGKITMLIKTADLIDDALEWAVAKSEGYDVYIPAFSVKPWLQIRTPTGNILCPKWSKDWKQCGDIIEREEIDVFMEQRDLKVWAAEIYKTPRGYIRSRGSTPMIAVMRCFVASKLGNEVEIPDELFSN